MFVVFTGIVVSIILLFKQIRKQIKKLGTLSQHGKESGVHGLVVKITRECILLDKESTLIPKTILDAGLFFLNELQIRNEVSRSISHKAGTF